MTAISTVAKSLVLFYYYYYVQPGGADQESKLNQHDIHDDGVIHDVHLDFYQILERQHQLIVDSILYLPLDTETTVMIFLSPQAITDHKIRRTSSIHTSITTHVQNVVNINVGKLAKPYKSDSAGIQKQFNVLSKTHLAIEQMHENSRDEFSKKHYHGDLVLLTGPMIMKEQKLFFTNLFLNKPPPHNANKPLLACKLDPVGCFATLYLGSSGWDVFAKSLDDVGEYFVQGVKMYLPPDGSNSTSDGDGPQQILTLAQYRGVLWDNIIEMLGIFVLPKECLHLALERCLSNLYTQEDIKHIPLPPCGT
eukprot:scaffold33998_cov62-Attheya_sp.AAC.3